MNGVTLRLPGLHLFNRLVRGIRAQQAEGRFPVAQDILAASSNTRRAEILLRLPDAIVLGQSVALTRACREAGFGIGILFLEARISALHANRDELGQLTEASARLLETWQQGFVELVRRGRARGEA